MKHLTSLVIVGVFALSWPTAQAAPREREYSIMTAEPYRAEVQLAQRRLTKFLSHLDPQRRALLDQTPYVAVQAYELTAGEVPGLTYRIGKGSAKSGQLVNDVHTLTNIRVKFLLIFDSRTQQLARTDGVLVTDTPRRNTIALFDGTRAVYVGMG